MFILNVKMYLSYNDVALCYERFVKCENEDWIDCSSKIILW